MFPLPILTYVKLGIIVIALFFSAYLGYSFEHSRFLAFKTAIAEETRQKEIEHQTAADKIEKDKNAQIKAINSQLVDAISELRKRPNRPENASIGQSGTGSTLYAEDAEFLIREASRADTIRVALQSCYQQYESIK